MHSAVTFHQQIICTLRVSCVVEVRRFDLRITPASDDHHFDLSKFIIENVSS